MIERLYLGPVPSEEQCSRVGDPRAKIECLAYLNQLKRLFPEAKFEITWEKHEFGMYPEVIVLYDYYNESEAKQAFEIEANLPELWDDRAKVELRK
jgi:hypothetical protein